MIELGPPVDKPPAIGIKTAKLFTNLEERTGIGHRGFDLHPVTNDLRITDETANSLVGVASDLFWVKFVEGTSISIAFFSKRATSSSRLARLRAPGFRNAFCRREQGLPILDRDISAIMDRLH
jgi:hypothetical protein